MPNEITVTVAHETSETMEFQTFASACAHAVREALDGATSVVLQDENGARYHVYAEPVDDA